MCHLMIICVLLETLSGLELLIILPPLPSVVFVDLCHNPAQKMKLRDQAWGRGVSGMWGDRVGWSVYF